MGDLFLMPKPDIDIPLVGDDISLPEDWLSISNELEDSSVLPAQPRIFSNDFTSNFYVAQNNPVHHPKNYTHFSHNFESENNVFPPLSQNASAFTPPISSYQDSFHVSSLRSSTHSQSSPRNGYQYSMKPNDAFKILDLRRNSTYLSDSKYRVCYISGGKDFESRVLCYFTESGVIPFYCNVCRRESYIKISKNNTITTSCNHFVSCNECRGRSVRRILRCKECSEEIAGIFPVCFEGKCIDLQDKEPVNTGACPLCERKLRKEQCDYDCRRRKTPEYSTARKKFNGVIIELVQNPDEIQKRGVWRPCPHFSFCPLHNVICRGHGKYSACSECKEQQKQQSKIHPPVCS